MSLLTSPYKCVGIGAHSCLLSRTLEAERNSLQAGVAPCSRQEILSGFDGLVVALAMGAPTASGQEEPLEASPEQGR